MARKSHVIGYRLGESKWWESRTPPTSTTTLNQEGEIISGIMEKMGYSTSNIQLEETDKIKRIKLIGNPSSYKWDNLEVYLMSYIKSLLTTYYNKPYELSYRQLKKYYKNGKMLAQMIKKSEKGLYTTMRKVKRVVMRERNKPKYSNYKVRRKSEGFSDRKSYKWTYNKR